MSKGSKYRPVNREKFDSNWENIFKNKKDMWEHNCKNNGQMSIEAGKPCDWCGQKEDGTVD
jgi:hypothetical protein